MATVKYHISPETGRPNICKAEYKCRLKDENGLSSAHFESKDEARAFAEQSLKNKHGSFSTLVKTSKKLNTSNPDKVIRQGKTMTTDTAFLKDSLKSMSRNLVETRAEYGSVSLGDYDKEKAKQRLFSAIEFADVRQDTNLMKKVSKAQVWMGARFKDVDGNAFTTDDLLDNQVKIKHIDEGRKKLVEELTDFARNNYIPQGTYKASNSAGSYSVTVKDGAFNEKEFNRIPESLRNELYKEEDTIDSALIREKLSKDKQEAILVPSQTISYVIGKPHNVGQDDVMAEIRMSGDNDIERFQSGVNNIAKFYEDSRNSFGTSYRDMKANSTKMSNVAKSSVQDVNSNVLLGARAASNGAVISHSYRVSKEKAEDLLTPAELASVTTKKKVIDIDKARKALAPHVFDRMFNARSVSLRVTEAK